MPKITAAQEQFLKDFEKSTTEELNRHGAKLLRQQLQNGNLKPQELTPEQILILEKYSRTTDQ